MASTSMPPPSSTLAHRRTTRLSASLNPKDTSPSCPSPRKMSLEKGNTFHCASSPSTDADPVLSVPYLVRRSPTCSHATLASLLSEKRELAAQYIADFEQTFSGARGHRGRNRERSAESFNETLKKLRESLPTDEGLGSSITSPASDKGVSKSLSRVELASDKDSALGASVSGTNVGAQMVAAPVHDGPVAPAASASTTTAASAVAAADAAQLIKDTDQRTPAQDAHRLPAPVPRLTTSYLPAASAEHPYLSRFARKKISELLVQPLLDQERFQKFHPLVRRLAKRTHKNIRCLRDLEQSLILQPLTRGLSVSPSLYRSFGELTVQLTVDTYAHLSESDQRRATDQPYNNGYFLDLVQQVQQLAAHIGRHRSAEDRENDEEAEAEQDQETPSADDEVTLEGGLGSTGDFAELVRWRNGKGISLRTGLPYEPSPGMKRQASTMTDEEIARSMARRKKGYIPEIIDMPCSDPTCDKVFNRKCDLAKHEKTHTRPFKCPHADCKYAEIGLPTEKERERHINDKHDPNPKLYQCDYCEFKTKRESNCKQHMEKKHDWQYRRAKGKDKDTAASVTGDTPVQTPHLSSVGYSPAMVQPSPAHTGYSDFNDGSSVAGSLPGSAQFTPYEEPAGDFQFNQQFSAPLFAPRPVSSSYVPAGNTFSLDTSVDVHNSNSYADFNSGYISPASSSHHYNASTTSAAVNKNQFDGMTPVTPAYSNITPSPYVEAMNLSSAQANQPFWPTPDSVPVQAYSRHPSVQYDSPAALQHQNFGVSMDPMISDHTFDMPQDDFDLFGGAFSNPTAGDQTLFPAGEASGTSQKYDAAMFEGIQDMDMDMEMELDNFDDMVNYNPQ